MKRKIAISSSRTRQALAKVKQEVEEEEEENEKPAKVGLYSLSSGTRFTEYCVCSE